MPDISRGVTVGDAVRFDFGATDAGSGVASMVGTFDGVPITPGASVTITSSGTHVFTLAAVDNAGNPASASLAIIATQPLPPFSICGEHL
jgi:hypothetical protein